MAEIKEIKGKGQRDEDLLHSISAGSRHSISPNLEFEYTDGDIHEDAFKVIKYSCEEMCTSKEQMNKVLNLWSTFLEPMLGVPSQPSNSHGSIKNTGACAMRETDNGTVDPNQPKPACKSPDNAHHQKNILENGATFAKEKDGHQPDKVSTVTENGHEAKTNLVAPVSQVKTLYV